MDFKTGFKFGAGFTLGASVIGGIAKFMLNRLEGKDNKKTETKETTE